MAPSLPTKSYSKQISLFITVVYMIICRVNSAANMLACRLIYCHPMNTANMANMNHRAERRPLALRGRVTWKDARGTTRFACVTTRDISETGVFIEWKESTSIPLYRLVSFQFERDVRNVQGIPPALRSGRVLSAVYRKGDVQRSTGTPEGYGLRLLIEPTPSQADASSEPVEATA